MIYFGCLALDSSTNSWSGKKGGPYCTLYVYITHAQA